MKKLPADPSPRFPQGLVSSLADEVAKTLARMPRFRRSKKKNNCMGMPQNFLQQIIPPFGFLNRARL